MSCKIISIVATTSAPTDQSEAEARPEPALPLAERGRRVAAAAGEARRLAGTRQKGGRRFIRKLVRPNQA